APSHNLQIITCHHFAMRCFRGPLGRPPPQREQREGFFMSSIVISDRARLRRGWTAGVSAAVLALSASPALAQDEPAGAAAGTGTGDQTIVVTGSRLFTSGMETPVPVTAVQGEELEAMDPSS